MVKVEMIPMVIYIFFLLWFALAQSIINFLVALFFIAL
jgi:hypothetical protein